ncbi:MAG: hypothetical protein AAF725_07630 [Acidobacteriota bacterium]
MRSSHFTSIPLLLLTLASAATDAEGVSAAPETLRRLVVQTDEEAIADALERRSFSRWVLPNAPGLVLEITGAASGQEIDAPAAERHSERTAATIEACTLGACTLRAQNAGDPGLEALRAKLAPVPAGFEPASAEGGGALRLGETRYAGSHLALAVRLPRAGGERRWVVYGFEPESVARAVDQVLFQESGVRSGSSSGRRPFDYLLLENDYSQRSGLWRLEEDGGVLLGVEERDDLAQRERLYAAMLKHRRPRVVLEVPPGLDLPAARLADRLESEAARLEKRLGVPLKAPIEVRVETDHVAQGRHTGAIGAAVLSSEGRLHLVHDGRDQDLYSYEMARLMLRRSGAAPRALFGASSTLEDGAALWLSGRWFGRLRDEWLADLVFADVLPDADELRARRRPGDGSRVLWPPVAAAILDRVPGETLAAKLMSERLEVHLEGPRLKASLRSLLAAAPPARPEAAEKGARALPFQRGLSFAMANGLEIGYHAPGIGERFERFERMGADSLSLMPFAYQRTAATSRLRFLNRSPSSETDVGVVHAARRAREAGFFVLWKPHIWLSFSSWPGDIEMESEAEWEAWWRSYRRYILHHAVLAEIAEADLFSVGVELGRTVDREAEWRHLISSVRRVFSGPLTYAGNWWADYDRVPFWDALDAVGVDAYFPLASSDEASDEDLRAGAQKMAQTLEADARRTGKPVILTEVGFAARRGAWVSPHEEGGDVSVEHQRRAWRAVREAFSGAGPWLRGLYAWKVFSHERYEGGDQPDFRFLERPAAAEVERWFRE